MKKIIIPIISILVLIILVTCYFIFRFKLEVTLSDNLNVLFDKEVNLKDYIIDSNATFIDKYVTLDKLGDNEVSISYTDKYGRAKEYYFHLLVIDEDAPFIIASNSITTYVGEDVDMLKGVICADYADSYVECSVVGDYDITILGSYNLKYEAIDSSGNKTYKDFKLNVIEKPKTTTKYTPSKPNYVYFTDVYNTYKSDDTKIGIDVSRFQGEIDFNKIKETGCDFVIIRLGWYIDYELGLDYNYEKYIKDAHDAGLDIGLYFYSEAKTTEEIDNIISFIKDNIKYDITMPISYDWEDFKDYNSYKLSIYEFNKLAYRFMDGIKSLGYSSMLYGSKSYLTNMWIVKDYDIWLAQYYNEVIYEGNYKMWQLTENGKIDGISGTVDIDIYYLNH